MEIINTYNETISHYNMKLGHAEDELNDAIRYLQELEVMAYDGWSGPAAEAFRDRVEELAREMAAPREHFEQIRQALAQLRSAIEEEIRVLMEEEASAKAKAAEAAALAAAADMILG